MLVRFTFPIDDFYGDGVFEKHVYFECTTCPSLEEVKAALGVEHKKEQLMSIQHPEWGPYCFEYKQCLDALENLERPMDFPCVGGSLIQSNVCVNHPRWGKQSLTVTAIQTLKTG